jgi:hypothetical protein
VGIVDDLVADVIAVWLQLTLPELVDFLGNAREGLFPTFFGLVDGASVVGAKMVGKAEDLDGCHSVLDRAVDDDRRLFGNFLVAQARRLAQALQEGLLLLLGRFVRPHGGGRLFTFGQRDLCLQFFDA